LNYQTTRARFVGDRAKRVVLWAAIGLLFAWMALIALTVGLIVALTPLLSAWGATAVVTIVWLLVAVVTLSVAASRWREVVRSFDDGEEDAA
jgi:membrane protein YdbS with pleckstrin-like domain